MSKIAVLLSGGLDSCVLAAQLLIEGHEVTGIHVSYGARHEHREKRAATAIAGRLSIPLLHSYVAAPLSSALMASSSIGIPHGHYLDEEMKSTIVPFRNGILMSVAAGVALSQEIDAIAIAAHSGGGTIYPDCGTPFLEAMSEAIRAGSEYKLDVICKYASSKKSEIVSLGHLAHAPMSLSYSCYEGTEQHCGKCGTCVRRKEAFVEAGVNDFTEYQGG